MEPLPFGLDDAEAIPIMFPLRAKDWTDQQWVEWCERTLFDHRLPPHNGAFDNGIDVLWQAKDEMELGRMTTNPNEEFGEYSERANRISGDALELHLSKAADYRGTGDLLGVKGQFAELWRKVGKLKGPMWDDEPLSLASESAAEILQDLIGHCIKAIDYLERDES